MNILRINWFWFCILPLLFPAQLLHSQDSTWENYFSNESYQFYDLKADMDGNYLMTGVTDTFGLAGITSRTITFKVSPEGNIIWRRTYTQGLSMFGSLSYGLALTNIPGHSVITGWGSYNIPGYVGALILREYDESGNVAWDKNYGFPYHVVNGAAITQTSGDGYIVTGSYDSCLYLMKANRLGDSTWCRTYPYFTQDIAFNGITTGKATVIETSDNCFLVCTSTKGFYSSMMIAKFSSSGDTIWSMLINDGLYAKGNSIIETSDGNYLACGAQFDNTYTCNAMLVKLTPEKDIIWSRQYDMYGYNDAFLSLAENQDGNIVACGSTNKSSEEIQTLALVVLVNSYGDTLWARTDGEGTNSTAEILNSIMITSDNGEITCGSHGSHLFAARLSSDGKGFEGIQNSPPQQPKYPEITVFDGTIRIDFTHSDIDFNHPEIRILNLNGQIIQSISADNPGALNISTNDYPTGLYLITIEEGNYRIVRKLLICQR
jgi:hypothetical protein